VGDVTLVSISDWQATDQPGDVIERIHRAEETMPLDFHPVVVGGEQANQALADRISSRRRGAILKEMNFDGLFRWCSQKLIYRSRTSPGQKPRVPTTEEWEAKR
jgi:uncharacterized protein YegL